MGDVNRKCQQEKSKSRSFDLVVLSELYPGSNLLAEPKSRQCPLLWVITESSKSPQVTTLIGSLSCQNCNRNWCPVSEESKQQFRVFSSNCRVLRKDKSSQRLIAATGIQERSHRVAHHICDCIHPDPHVPSQCPDPQ